MAGSKTMLTELSFHHRLEICGPLWPTTCLLLQTPIIFTVVICTWKSSSLKCPPHTLAVSDKGSVKFKSRLWIHWNRNNKIKYYLHKKSEESMYQKQWCFTCIRRTGSLGNLNIPSLALFLHPSTMQGWTMISPPPPTGDLDWDLEMCPFSSLDSFVSQMTSLLFAEVEFDL